MKFGSSVADTFVIKRTQFGLDAFRFDISVLHCLGLYKCSFFVDTVYILEVCTYQGRSKGAGVDEVGWRPSLPYRSSQHENLSVSFRSSKYACVD